MWLVALLMALSIVTIIAWFYAMAELSTMWSEGQLVRCILLAAVMFISTFAFGYGWLYAMTGVH